MISFIGKKKKGTMFSKSQAQTEKESGVRLGTKGRSCYVRNVNKGKQKKKMKKLEGMRGNE